MAAITEISSKPIFSKDEVVELVAEALGTSAKDFDAESAAGDLVEWDSMGILGILTALTRVGIPVDADEIGLLGSMEGVLAAFRGAGRLEGDASLAPLSSLPAHTQDSEGEPEHVC